ncbi:flavodoxin domain-containing protein [Actinacidiphila soli]|uniref:flavodoxin domain-containing protein n=1 Tax=Actinacidiphila soli TaxID=2487275 RepID=UPI000FCA7D3A|nr:flavodoxin domain-containing protein [Actinacidiphila soli]
MTAQRVLIAYGTKNGSTAEIAEWIAEELREQGIDTDVRSAAAVRDIAPYDAVVLGAGLYAGGWQCDAARFARQHRQALTQRPVWLFSSGPLDASATEREIPPARGVARIIARLDARDHVTFGGRLTEGAEGFIARQILQQGKGGDFRDREQVRTWAHDIAAELTPAAEHR